MKIIIEADSVDELKILLERITQSQKPTQADMHIREMPLNHRIKAQLLANEIETYSALKDMDEYQLARLPGIGKRSASEIIGVLSMVKSK